MVALEAAIVEVTTILESLTVPYMLVGGLAVAVWGEPRATLDIDLTIWVEPEKLEHIIFALCQRLLCSPRDPLSFVRRTRVLPLRTAQNIRTDIIFASLPAEKEAIRRACTKELGGKAIRIAAVEDLVLMKLVSEREKDLEDARRLLGRHKQFLDHNYLAPRLTELSEALDRPEIRKFFDDAVK